MRSLALWMLAACAESNPAGDWAVDSSSFAQDDCQATTDLLPTGDLLVSTLNEKLFIDFKQGGPEVECDRNGGGFSCEATDVWSDSLRAAQITVSMSTEGEINKANMVGTRTGTTTCEGADCGFLEETGNLTFPCAIRVEFTATKSE